MTSGEIYDRAFGVLVGQCVGDALGAQVEFRTGESIRTEFPAGVRHMTGGGPFNLAPGQITDDSEMALALARSIRRTGFYCRNDAAGYYRDWADSHPFDMGGTTANACRAGYPSNAPLAAQMHVRAKLCKDSEANGALMRVSPLGILCCKMEASTALFIGAQDAALTHVHPFCQTASGVFVAAIGALIRGEEPLYAYELAVEGACSASAVGFDSKALDTLIEAADRPPVRADTQQGHVRHALQNAFFRLLRAPTFEEGIVATIAMGGDTDTNAAIAGALLGARFGAGEIPGKWKAPMMISESPRPMDFRPWDLDKLTIDLLLSAARE